MNSEYKDRIRAAYNAAVNGYIARDRGSVAETEDVREAIARFASVLPSGGAVLDVGCGGGRDARKFAELGFGVTGIDLAEKLLAAAAAIGPKGAIAYMRMDAENLDLPERSFDGIWANASLHHMPKSNLLPALNGLRRVIKPGGQLCLIVHAGYGERWVETDKFGPKVSRFFAEYQPGELSAIVESAGFFVAECQNTTGGKWVRLSARA